MLLVVGAKDRSIARVFQTPLLVALGRRSYAMYLVHATIIAETAHWFRTRAEALSIGGSRLPSQLAFATFVFLASYAAAVVSWHVLERHCMSLKRFFPLPRPERIPASGASLRGSWRWPAGATIALGAFGLLVSVALHLMGMGDAPPLRAAAGGALRIRFDRPLPGSGWYPPDTMSDGYGAWTSAQQSTLRVNLEPGCSYRLGLHVLAAVSPEVSSTLRAGFGETEIPLEATRDAAGGVQYEGVIPKSAVTPNGSVFLRVAEISTPSSLGLGTDSRPRGVLVDDLRIEPVDP
jgi:hypothetical protein